MTRRRLIFWTDGFRYRWLVLALGCVDTDWEIVDMDAIDKNHVRHSPIADGIKMAYTGERQRLINTCTTVARYAAASKPHRRLWIRDTGWRA